MSVAEPIWRPSAERIARSVMTRYMEWLRQDRALDLRNYEALWEWSVTDLQAFWKSIADFCGLRLTTPAHTILSEPIMPGAKWFDGATLNYADQMLWRALQPEWAHRPALVFSSELVERREISWGQLAADVGALSATLERLGVRTGDRAVSYMPNIPEAAVAMLATTGMGAIWSSCSPDMGSAGVLDRFRQIEPALLFAVDGYRYGGRSFDRRDIVRELVSQLPSLRAVIFVPYLDAQARVGEMIEVAAQGEEPARSVAVVTWLDALSRAAQFVPKAVPFDHPLWIVYSSGTTGMPKPIVHGHGGTTIEYLKAMQLHFDLGENDRFFWFASTNWIMWNYNISALISGSTVLLFDGNPGHPDLGTLWRLVERERVTFFGLSPAFVQLSMKNQMRPGERFDLSSLRCIGATGSPLAEDGYRWIYSHVHPDVLLASISGGTDPNAAFLGTCPVSSLFAGEMQARGLGLSVYAYDDAGQAVYDEVGELVCTKPAPSMPLYFWGDTDGRRYFDSYFDVYPGVWRHGDWLKLVRRPEAIGGIIYGRSDSTINRQGIRMGTSEIYRVVEGFEEIEDSLVIDLEYLARESLMLLFVVMRAPHVFSEDIRTRLQVAIRTQLSARHVPNGVLAISEVPRTISGKKLEVPVKKILLGQAPERACNRSAMSNPRSIDWFIEFARSRSH